MGGTVTLKRETLTWVATSISGIPGADGTPVITEVKADYGPCNVQQSSTTETRGGREITVQRLRVIGPLNRGISSKDRMIRGGRTYEVDGEPAHFVAGSLDHTETVLIEWEGQ